MSSPRTQAAELSRLLNSVAGPLYVVDDQRRIVFCNQAAASWIGIEAGQLVGLRCDYHSAGDVSNPATALCPPPETFHGQRATDCVTVTGADDQSKTRRAEFIPLPGDTEPCVAVLVLLAMAEADTTEASAPPAPSLDGEAAVLHQRLRRFRRELRQRHGVERLVGDSPAMRQVRAQVALAAGSRVAVLIVGPNGSGRKDVAKAIHYGGDRDGAGPLVPLSCSTLAAELLRSTIAALAAKSTLRQSLDQGTILLNDVEQAPPEAQAELAALLTTRLPGPRVVATATEPLAPRVAAGEFRADLACELSTLVIQVPPLAQRRDDLPLVAQMLLEDVNALGKKQLRGFSAESLDALAAYPWPGNVTELEQIVREAHARAEGFEISPGDLPKRIHLSADAQNRSRRRDEPIVLEKFLAQVETELIRRALARAKGNKSRAAKLLGMTRPRLYRRMVQLGLAEE